MKRLKKYLLYLPKLAPFSFISFFLWFILPLILSPLIYGRTEVRSGFDAHYTSGDYWFGIQLALAFGSFLFIAATVTSFVLSLIFYGLTERKSLEKVLKKIAINTVLTPFITFIIFCLGLALFLIFSNIF